MKMDVVSIGCESDGPDLRALARPFGRHRRLVPPRPGLTAIGIIGNLVLCVLGGILVRTNGPNQWVDGESVKLLFLLGAENIGMLLVAKRHNNPFIFLLAGTTTIFYLGRIVSLLYEPFSIAFTFAGLPITSNDTNTTLWVIGAFNLAIFLGSYAAGGRHYGPSPALSRGKLPGGGQVGLVLCCVYVINYFLVMRLDYLGRIAGYIQGVALDIQTILLMAMLYLWLAYRRLRRFERVGLGVLILVFVPLVMIIGSRSGVLTLAVLAMCLWLASGRRIRVKWTWLALGLLAAGLAPVIFDVATRMRDGGYQPGRYISVESVTTALTGNDTAHEPDRTLAKLVFDRMGFLDYSTVVIAGQEQFAVVMNPSYYARSIVDNVLTPGFNVFGTPKVSNTMHFLTWGYLPNHADVAQNYNSSQISVYGEYYVLCGFTWALPLVGALAFAFSWIYQHCTPRTEFGFFLFRAIVLLLFYGWLISFGIDWSVMQLVTILITVTLMKRFFVAQRASGLAPGRTAARRRRSISL